MTVVPSRTLAWRGGGGIRPPAHGTVQRRPARVSECLQHVSPLFAFCKHSETSRGQRFCRPHGERRTTFGGSMDEQKTYSDYQMALMQIFLAESLPAWKLPLKKHYRRSALSSVNYAGRLDGAMTRPFPPGMTRPLTPLVYLTGMPAQH